MNSLYLISTPIGNLEDISIRALKTLFSVDYIACEDTRRTGQLLKILKQKYTLMIRIIREKMPGLISFYDEVEEKKLSEIIGLLEDNKSVALVSDSGTPLIADPGYKLVRECLKRGIKIVSIPGPSALITALTVSGLPPDNFLFLGFLPANQTKRIKLLNNILACSKIAIKKPTVIFYESPHRITSSLSDLQNVFGDIEIVLTRELTKIHEEIFRGKISEAIAQSSKFKGEIVLLFFPKFCHREPRLWRGVAIPTGLLRYARNDTLTGK
jgi:16S rRNA (cytidine1402-2'-O)-methyltransferase